MRPAWRATPVRALALRWAASAAALLVSCQAPGPRLDGPRERGEWPSPAQDATGVCADVGDRRACWPDPRTILAAPRPTPTFNLSPMGFRCGGVGSARTCVDRGATAAPFRCSGTDCVQSPTRLPDDGEWECADLGGVVVCRGGEHAAGIPPGAASGGFFCGARRGARASAGERICVDLSPDVPDGVPRGIDCGYEARGAALSRHCRARRDAHGITDACDAAHPCVSGLFCVSGACLPRRPDPSCWVDGDCDQGVCRFGSCLEGVP